jgi:tetratricopeptide (TPR) repeat protein
VKPVSSYLRCQVSILAFVCALAVSMSCGDRRCFGQAPKPKNGLPERWNQLTEKVSSSLSRKKDPHLLGNTKAAGGPAAAESGPKIDSRQSGVDILLANARNCENRGENAQAIGLYEEILERQPHAVAFHRLGRLLYIEGQESDAWDCLNKAVEMDPKNIELQADVSYLLYLSEDYVQAEKWARAGLKSSPRHQRLNNNLGLILVGQEKHADAYQAFVQGGKSRGDAMASVGQACLLLDQPAEAEQYLSMAAKQSTGETKQKVEESLQTLARLTSSKETLAPIITASGTSKLQR